MDRFGWWVLPAEELTELQLLIRIDYRLGVLMSDQSNLTSEVAAEGAQITTTLNDLQAQVANLQTAVANGNSPAIEAATAAIADHVAQLQAADPGSTAATAPAPATAAPTAAAPTATDTTQSPTPDNPAASATPTAAPTQPTP